MQILSDDEIFYVKKNKTPEFSTKFICNVKMQSMQFSRI